MHILFYIILINVICKNLNIHIALLYYVREISIALYPINNNILYENPTVYGYNRVWGNIFRTNITDVTLRVFNIITVLTNRLSFQTMLYALADSLSALGRDAEAETYYRQLLRVNPTDVSAFLTYGDLLAKNVITRVLYLYIYILYTCIGVRMYT